MNSLTSKLVGCTGLHRSGGAVNWWRLRESSEAIGQEIRNWLVALRIWSTVLEEKARSNLQDWAFSGMGCVENSDVGPGMSFKKGKICWMWWKGGYERGNATGNGFYANDFGAFQRYIERAVGEAGGWWHPAGVCGVWLRVKGVCVLAGRSAQVECLRWLSRKEWRRVQLGTGMVHHEDVRDLKRSFVWESTWWWIRKMLKVGNCFYC